MALVGRLTHHIRPFGAASLQLSCHVITSSPQLFCRPSTADCALLYSQEVSIQDYTTLPKPQPTRTAVSAPDLEDELKQHVEATRCHKEVQIEKRCMKNLHTHSGSAGFTLMFAVLKFVSQLPVIS